MDYEERYNYLENVLYFIQEVYGRYYDADRYKNERISYYDMPYCMMDELLFRYKEYDWKNQKTRLRS